MKNSSIFHSMCGAAALLCLLVPVSAQPGGPQRGDHAQRGDKTQRGDGPRDGFRRGDGPRRGFERGSRAKGELMRLWRGIGELEKGSAALSKAQAARVVALVRPWSNRATLSDADATQLHDQLEAVLTSAQRTQLQNGRPFGPRNGRRNEGRGSEGRGRRGGPEQGRDRGMGRGPREGRGEDGDRPQRPTEAEFATIRAFMEAQNPFYAPTGYANWSKLPSHVQQNVAERYRENRTLLESLSRRSND